MLDGQTLQLCAIFIVGLGNTVVDGMYGQRQYIVSNLQLN